jgi:hypothetical protein
VAALVMSPTNPQSAAFHLKNDKKLDMSHIIFQNSNMGLMVRYFQELELYDLKVEFKDQLAITVFGKPKKFEFQEIALGKAKEQNSGLVNCQMQGYLFKKKT